MRSTRVLLVVAVLLGAAAAQARRPSDADAAIQRGVQLRRQGDDQAGLEQFQRAYELERTPRALAQIGLAQVALGRWVEASDALANALAAADDPWIQKNRATLERMAGEVGRHIGEIDVDGDPRGAAVSLNGVAAGNLPLRAKVVAGEVVVSVSAPEHVPLMRTVQGDAGEPARESRPLWKTWWFWTLAGAVAAGAVAAAVLVSRGSGSPSCPNGDVCTNLP
jgi:tetratricopeptide (TPR) repeat protein